MVALIAALGYEAKDLKRGGLPGISLKARAYGLKSLAEECAVGLPTLWVMFAIIIGGAMFGVVGMFIGIPVFSVIYTLIEDWIHRRLKEKKIYFPPADKEE